jgi:uncharacterized membrane protein YgcG
MQPIHTADIAQLNRRLAGNTIRMSKIAAQGSAARGAELLRKSKRLNFGKRKTMIGAVALEADQKKLLAHECLKYETAINRLEVYLIFNVWLSMSQVEEILRAFNAYGQAPEAVLVRVVSLCFSRIVDLENFGIFLRKSTTTSSLRQELIHRLGILNVFCAMTPDGEYDLDLAARDHREAARILIQLAALEHGESISDVSYVKSMLQPCKPRWKMPAGWGEETSGPPKYGLLALKYECDPTKKCEPDYRARVELTALKSLAGTRGTFVRGVEFSKSAGGGGGGEGNGGGDGGGGGGGGGGGRSQYASTEEYILESISHNNNELMW